jgi:hypothetical protein
MHSNPKEGLLPLIKDYLTRLRLNFTSQLSAPTPEGKESFNTLGKGGIRI